MSFTRGLKALWAASGVVKQPRSRHAVPRLELLEDRNLLSWGGTPPLTVTPPAAAAAVTLDSQGDATGNASISTTEVDWYKFTATTAGSYIFQATTPNSYVDTVTAVYDSAGNRKSYNDDISSWNTDSRFTVNLLAGQVYYFGVTNYQGTSGGSYTWKIDGPAGTTTVTDDTYENNDTQATASNLGTPAAAQTITGLKMADGQDWYVFTTTATGTSTDYVSIAFTHSQGDLDMKLFNGSGTQLGASEGTTNEERISLNGLAAGTYFIQVFGYNGASNPSYSLTIDPAVSTGGGGTGGGSTGGGSTGGGSTGGGGTGGGTTTGDAWTVFVYMTASNLQDFAFQDINEMESAVAQLPSTVNVVVFWDQSAAYAAYATGNGSQAAWKTAGRAVIAADTNMSRVATTFNILPEQNSGNPATLTSFLQWGVSAAPAAHYGLILWNHGAGLYGSNYDDSDNAGEDFLSINEVASALGSSTLPRMDLVAYDACLMGMAEVGYGLRNVTGVFAASEELEAGEGHDYTTLFNVLKTSPASVTAEQLGSGFVSSFGSQYVGTGVSEDTYSAVRTSSYAGLTTALQTFVNSTATATSTVRTAMRTARNNAITYDGEVYQDFRDLGSFMRNVANNTTIPSAIRTAANGVLSALGQLVISKTNDGRSSSGVAIYLPGNTVDSTYASSFSAFNAATGWNSFVNWLATGSRTATSTTTSGTRGPAQRVLSDDTRSWAAPSAAVTRQAVDHVALGDRFADWGGMSAALQLATVRTRASLGDSEAMEQELAAVADAASHAACFFYAGNEDSDTRIDSPIMDVSDDDWVHLLDDDGLSDMWNMHPIAAGL